MPKSKKGQKNPSTFETVLHALIHLGGILFIFWCVTFLPLWASYLAIVIEVAQMKLLGRCFLTIIAHNRGIMTGMTYWQYIVYKLGANNHKQVGYIIDSVIKVLIISILLFRTIQIVLLQVDFQESFLISIFSQKDRYTI